MSLAPAASTHALIPVLVKGIQPRRVRAVNDSPAANDLGALDSCGIPRAKPEDGNEGETIGLAGLQHIRPSLTTPTSAACLPDHD
ncbi:hypothetical protein EHI42_14680 [Rhizobium hidalgonense]|nr:hypothetical protein EHI42_14680 [Rhizobium hidalgonense]